MGTTIEFANKTFHGGAGTSTIDSNGDVTMAIMVFLATELEVEQELELFKKNEKETETGI